MAVARAGVERRAAADRRARDMQIILEHPALLRQRDQLASEVAQLKQVAVEREQAAFEEGREEGLQAGREVPSVSASPLVRPCGHLLLADPHCCD